MQMPQSITPSVTIIMAAYNAEETIVEAVNSILDQSYSNLELVICDDASTDQTAALITRISDARIKLIRNRSNVGPGRSRDIAIQASSAPWIAFIDADDAWHPERLKILMNVTCQNDNAIIFDDLIECRTSSTGRLIPWRRMRGRGAFESFSTPVIIDTSQLIRSERMFLKPIFPRRLVDTFSVKHSNHPYGEDSHFLLKLLSVGAQLIYVPEAMYFYRLSTVSASNNPDRHDMLLDILSTCLLDFRESPGTQKAIDKKIGILVRQKRRFQFTNSIRQKKILLSFRILLTNPSVALDVLKHFQRSISRKLHPKYR